MRARNFQDISGQCFGRLTAISLQSTAGPTKWLCKCSCGNETVTNASNLKRGLSNSCGCLRKELMAEKQTTHGLSDKKIYILWRNMVSRCYDLKDARYSAYGGRGIKVCDRWRESVENFYSDMGNRPSGKSLDRINNDGNYSPENCKWSTNREQSNNKRLNKNITYQGETHTYAEWEQKLGGCSGLIWNRLKLGWSEEKAVSTPIAR